MTRRKRWGQPRRGAPSRNGVAAAALAALISSGCSSSAALPTSLAPASSAPTTPLPPAVTALDVEVAALDVHVVQVAGDNLGNARDSLRAGVMDVFAKFRETATYHASNITECSGTDSRAAQVRASANTVSQRAQGIADPVSKLRGALSSFQTQVSQAQAHLVADRALPGLSVGANAKLTALGTSLGSLASAGDALAKSATDAEAEAAATLADASKQADNAERLGRYCHARVATQTH